MHYDVNAVIDLTPADGRLATKCALEKKAYLGTAFTEDHAAGLERHTKENIFKSYCTEGSADYDAELAQVIAEANDGDSIPPRKVAAKAKAKGKAKGKARAKRAARAKAKAGDKPEARTDLVKKLKALQGRIAPDKINGEDNEEASDDDEQDQEEGEEGSEPEDDGLDA